MKRIFIETYIDGRYEGDYEFTDNHNKCSGHPKDSKFLNACRQVIKNMEFDKKEKLTGFAYRVREEDKKSYSNFRVYKHKGKWKYKEDDWDSGKYNKRVLTFK